MAVRIVRNTTSDPVVLTDLDAIMVPGNGQIDLGLSFTLEKLAASDSLAISLASGSLVLVIEDQDVPFPRSLDIIRNVPQIFRVTADQKLLVNATPQPSATTDFTLTSITDSSGSGVLADLLHVDHTVFTYGQDTQGVDQSCGLYVNNGQTNELSKYWLNSRYLNFHVLGNRTFLYDGGVMWRGLMDNGANGLLSLTFSAVSSVFDPSDYEVSPGTGNCTVLDGYLVVPMPGGAGGSHTLIIGQNEDNTPQGYGNITGLAPAVNTGKYNAPTFWQIDYNLTSKKFFNLLPTENPYAETRSLATGDSNVVRVYGNFFTTEIPLAAYVKDLLVLGNSSNYFSISSSDATEIPHGIQMRVDCKTIVSNVHSNVNWTMVGYLKTYREHTV